MTFLNNITFVNFKARPSMGYFAPTIFWTITWCVGFYTRITNIIN